MSRLHRFLQKVSYTITLILGVSFARRAGRDPVEFFGAGRTMPWWLLGFSMVATTFSTDTPNLVSDIVRTHGVAGNWLWWAFLLNAMLTVFVFAQLWRRSGVLTDIEFCELRYSGRAARFLRGFRAVYLGLFLNVIVIATVSLAAIKIGSVLLNLSPLQTIFLTSLVTVVYSSLGGLRGIVMTDFLHFIAAMVGTVIVAIVAVNQPEVGGLSGLVQHEVVRERLSLLPDFTAAEVLVAIFIVPLAVQWWATFYPGAEPSRGPRRAGNTVRPCPLCSGGCRADSSARRSVAWPSTAPSSPRDTGCMAAPWRRASLRCWPLPPPF